MHEHVSKLSAFIIYKMMPSIKKVLRIHDYLPPIQMDIKKIIEIARLKLEHHPWGQRMMLLISPFYVRPHHFWDARNSIIGRMGVFAPMLVAMLYWSLSTAVSDLLLHNYASKQAITLPVLDAFNYANKVSALTIVLLAMIAIYAIAIIQYLYNKLLFWFWTKMNKQVKRAPYAFYASRQASWALWFYLLLRLMLFVIHNGVNSSVEALKNFLTAHSIFGFCLLLLYYFLYQTVQKNSMSSSMELYGSKGIIFINSLVAIIFLYAFALIYPLLFLHH